MRTFLDSFAMTLLLAAAGAVIGYSVGERRGYKHGYEQCLGEQDEP